VTKKISLPQRVPLTQGCLVGWRVLLGRTLLRAQALEQVRSRLPERAQGRPLARVRWQVQERRRQGTLSILVIRVLPALSE
jgi:hypothetical protein